MKDIYVKPTQGLGNRLLLLDSLFAFAKEAGFDSVKICWCTSKGFSDEKFEDLFDIDALPKNAELISLQDYDQAKKYAYNLDQHVDQDPESLKWAYDVDKDQIINTIVNSTFCYESYAPLNWVFSFKLKDDGVFLRGNLKPNKKLRKRIDQVYQEDMDALHIRRGDAVIGPWNRFYKLSGDEAFHKKLKQKPNKKFFLSTDCAKTEAEFLSLYPDQIIVNNQKQFVPDDVTVDDEKGCQDDAVIDMFLLSKAQNIYGTNWSTFNKTANIIGQNNLDRLISHKLPDFTAITAVKNRFDVLKVSIQSWLLQDKIKEIIVVDWSSDDFDSEYLLNLDSRIKVVTIKEEEHFHLSKAYNIAINHASNDYIIKLDVDYILNPYFNLSEHLDVDLEKEFLSGYWKQKELDGDLGFLEYLNGFLCIKKEYLVQVGGYQGNQFGYGNDDCDLYVRLKGLGLVRRGINFKKNFIPILHIPHKDVKRVENYKEKNIKTSLGKNRSVNYSENY